MLRAATDGYAVSDDKTDEDAYEHSDGYAGGEFNGNQDFYSNANAEQYAYKCTNGYFYASTADSNVYTDEDAYIHGYGNADINARATYALGKHSCRAGFWV
jgi:hypothetical protein